MVPKEPYEQAQIALDGLVLIVGLIFCLSAFVISVLAIFYCTTKGQFAICALLSMFSILMASASVTFFWNIKAFAARNKL
jgi:hypothetical protein